MNKSWLAKREQDLTWQKHKRTPQQRVTQTILDKTQGQHEGYLYKKIGSHNKNQPMGSKAHEYKNQSQSRTKTTRPDIRLVRLHAVPQRSPAA